MIFLSDGERALQDRQSEYLPENTICILDLFHVLERLWKVAWCFFDERAQKRQAHQWVEERLKRLLEGRVASVIRGIRYQATQYGLRGQRRKTVKEAADYFERNRDRMKYDEYLAAGYPIGSGVVEGACRHLVKDRMERSGMRWLPSERTGDARPESDLPQWGVERLLEIPCGARRSTALRQNTHHRMRKIQ